MSLTRKRKPSPRQVEANRRNGRKSNGPRTPHGKLHVALNALQHGLHAEPVLKAMLGVGEKPRAFYRLLAQLIASLRPANPHQRMQVEDIAHLRCEKQRLKRARLALIAGKMHRLERERDRRLLEFDYDAPDLPQAELLHKGLDRVPDSAPKFEKMLSCFEVLISVAKQGQFTLDPEPELNLLYGQEPSLDGAYLRNVFRRFVAAQGAARDSGWGVQPQPQPEELSAVPEGAPSGLDPALRPVQNPRSKIPNTQEAPSEQERLLLLKNLFAAKQRALRRYHFYNREYAEITSDQRDACYAPGDAADVYLMRLEAQNDRQLRLALKLYWQTQKEDAALAARPGEEAEGTDNLLEALEKSLEVVPDSEARSPNTDVLGDGHAAEIGALETSNFQKQSHQVLENTGEVSRIGQNNPNIGNDDSPLMMGDLPPAVGGQSVIDHQSAIPTPEPGNPNSAHLVEVARPKVKELLEQMQSDPEARALVETFLLSQMVQEDSQQEEVELAALQRERQKRETLEEGLEQMVAAQQELEKKNRRLRARVAESEVLHQQVREQTKPAGLVVPQRREPTHEEIIAKISAAIGVGLPMKHYVTSQVEGMPGYHLTEEEYADYTQGRGPAWEQEQRRRREQEKRRLESERLEK